MPEIIIIDEIGTELEAEAARTIAERGVQLVGTAHGNKLKNLVKNPTITDLIGGIQYVTLGDEEAKRRGSSKSILERKASPTLDICVEIHDPKTWIIHSSIEHSIDLLLQGQSFPVQQRTFFTQQSFVECKIIYNQHETESIHDGSSQRTDLERKSKNNFLLKSTNASNQSKINKVVKVPPLVKQEFIYIYIYGINNHDLKSLIKTLRLPIIITKEVQYADAILALANLVKNNRKLKQISHSRKITIHTIQSNSLVKIAKALKLLAKKNALPSVKEKSTNTELIRSISQEFLTPLDEARLAVEEILIPKGIAVDLIPRPGFIRKQQYELLTHYNLKGVTVGELEKKRMRILPVTKVF
jgi:hypothetical protein